MKRRSETAKAVTSRLDLLELQVRKSESYRFGENKKNHITIVNQIKNSRKLHLSEPA